MHFSRRTEHDASPNALEQALHQRRQSGLAVFDLTVSNPTQVGLPFDAAAIAEALAHPRSLSYAPEPLGHRAPRQFLADRFGVPASQIFLTSSTSEAFTMLFKLLSEPGDHILVPAPSYPLFDFLATFENLEHSAYPLLFDGVWHLDREALRAQVTPRTRAILCVSPNNPTGHFLNKSDLAWLLTLGIPIIVDEVFEAYAAGNISERATPRQVSQGLVFSLGGLSKECLLPQMKLAWTTVAGEPSLRDEALCRLELLLDAYLSANTPVQLALGDLVSATNQTRAALAERLAENRATLEASAKRSRGLLTVLPSDGGFYAVLRAPLTQSDEAWAEELVRDLGVYVHPGAFFGFSGGAHLVVSLLPKPQEFALGLETLISGVGARV